ncbi:ATP-binding cassette domain-containing protein [Streptomyces lunaelactis]|uniref:ATP-binding cassette domain-containing protein n=1 Tax=Streptomyces lunaelactis TaxID=1535768 RepID=UPI0015852608|nr:ATP-binding cassette domain-containing protein [Streptomyces lunaelactis]NUK78484.1 ATP-binding cassette domain-containing protein [Streptomyces lunaelactis]
MEYGNPPLFLALEGIIQRLDPAKTYTVGRDPQSDAVFQEAIVSWRHARIYWGGRSWALQDLDSTNGTYDLGRRVSLAEVGHGAVFRLGDADEGPQLRFTGPPTHPGIVSAASVTRIGRSSDNDLVVREPEVQPHHAEFRFTPASYEIVDLGTPHGTHVNGHRVERTQLRPNDTVTVGRRTFRLIGDRLRDCADAEEPSSLIARRLTVKVKCDKGQRTLLNKVSFAVPPKALVAVIGPSGSGKSTLLRALTGHQRIAKGEVLYDNQSLHERYAELRQHIGIVPQHDVLHLQLTVRTALRYAARLRFPRGTDPVERDRRVEEVMSELKLDLHADKRIAALSGGQRKRVSVALELLTKPALMFLDEPTSGLDAGMDRDVMQLLRGLADDGRTVLVVTHSVRELELCDKVLVLSPGGSLAYFGPPDEALEFFGHDTWADVFSAFEEHREHDWSRRWRESQRHLTPAVALRPADGPAAPAAPEAVHPPKPPKPPKPPRWTAQLSTLVRRHVAVIASDRGFVCLLVLLPVLLGLANTVVPADFGLRRAPDGKANIEAGTILVSLAISMCFVGAANSVRELVKERAIYERERAAGLSRSAYLMSKITVLGLITGLQGIILCALGLAPRELPPEGIVVNGTPVVEMTFVITLLGFTSMMCGLLISSLVKTAEKTMPLLVLFSVVQYLFSGVTFRLFDNPGAEQVAWLVPSRWAIAAEGATLDLGQLLGPQDRTAPSATDPLWHHTLTQWLTDTGVLLGTAMACYLLTIRFLRRHEPEVVRK